MKLYHGTSRQAVPSILDRGIEPRSAGHRNSNWKHTVESNKDCVYLSQGYALYFAINAVKDIADCAIVEVESDFLDPSHLIPDEDAIEQSNRGRDGLPASWDMRRRTRHYRKMMRDFNDGQWQISIDNLGTCSHYGVVPPSAITRVALINLKANVPLLAACDPSIHLLNHKIMGGYYRQMTAYIFGDGIDADDLGVMADLRMK